MRVATRIAVLATVLPIAAIGVGTVVLVERTARTATSDHAACLVQARGLRAQHHLAAALVGIRPLLIGPPAVMAIVNRNLRAYVTTENQQPETRKC